MSESKVKFTNTNNNTLTNEEREELLRSVLPSCQPQEGSPANTFTQAELDDLQKALPKLQIGPRDAKKDSNKIDICDLNQWQAPAQQEECPPQDGCYEAPPQDGCEQVQVAACPQDCESIPAPASETLDWHGAPRFHKQVDLPRAFREKVRRGEFTTPTNGVCPGFLQCNLVVLPQGPVAFDFLLFCQRNPKACPLIEVCDVGSPYAPGVAPGADIRTDVPK